LVTLRFANLSYNASVKLGDLETFYQECPNILYRDHWWQKLQCFDGIKAWTMTADQIEGRLQEVCSGMDSRAEVDS